MQVARPIPILIPRPKKCPNRDRYWYHSLRYRFFDRIPIFPSVSALHRAPFQNAIKMKTFNKGPGESNLFQNIQKWISTSSTYTNICYLLIYLKVYHRHFHVVQTAVTLQEIAHFLFSFKKQEIVGHRVVNIWFDHQSPQAPFRHHWDGATTSDWKFHGWIEFLKTNEKQSVSVVCMSDNEYHPRFCLCQQILVQSWCRKPHSIVL